MVLFDYLDINQSQILIGKMIFLQNELVIGSQAVAKIALLSGVSRTEKDFENLLCEAPNVHELNVGLSMRTEKNTNIFLNSLLNCSHFF